MFVSHDHDECLQAAIHVGCAVELLAKAYLASVEQTLLADRGERESVLFLANKGHLVSATGPTDIRTISAFDALSTAKLLHPTLPCTLPADRIVLKVRNAAAHMALVEMEELRRAIVVMCRIVEGLLVPLELEREEFWSMHALPVVNDMLDQAKTEVRRLVAAKEAAARRRLATLTQGLDVTGTALVLSSLSGRRGGYADHQEPQTCPACGQQGWLLCTVVDVVNGDVVDGEECSWTIRTAYPDVFECPVCELDLREEELLEKDFPTAIEIEHEPDQDIEPDEDIERDR